ncbi:hypothetical protein SAMN05216371_7501 [Streptomyces sp. TLI_053]|nr:hypothetical protein SAMN05216371_7501 [Streptomyces sp. TLI_053]
MPVVLFGHGHVAVPAAEKLDECAVAPPAADGQQTDGGAGRKGPMSLTI